MLTAEMGMRNFNTKSLACILIFSVALSAQSVANQGTTLEGKTPEVAPGITLPPTGVVFVLDNVKGVPTLARLALHDANYNKHTAQNNIKETVVPYVFRWQSTLELMGLNSPTRLASRRPVFYVRNTAQVLNEQEGEKKTRHYELLGLKWNFDRRTVATRSFSRFKGVASRNEKVIPTKTEPLQGTDWLKITPLADLPQGEYALVNMPDDKKEIETSVYDFGID